MTSYKKTIATMVLASMLVATVAYAEEAQAEDQATRSLQFAGVRTPAHPRLFGAGKALNKFGRWENRMGRNEFMNGMPAIGLASMASGFGNRGAGHILKRAGWGGGCGPFGGCGRKLLAAEEAPEFEGRSLQQFGGFGHGGFFHDQHGMPKRHPFVHGMAQIFGLNGLARATAGPIPGRAYATWNGNGRKLQESQEAQAEDQATRSLQFAGVRTPAHPRLFGAGKALNKFGRWENRMGRNEFMNGMPAIGLASMASGFGNRGAGHILKRAGWGGGCGPFGGCGK